MNRPSFLDASPEEITNWANLPLTKAFGQWLVWEIERGRETEHDLLKSDRIGAARIACGTIDALTWVLGSLHKPVQLPEPKVEEFVDTAERPSQRGKK